MSDLEGNIKQRISYKQPPISLYNISRALGSSALVRPVSRTDYWEDGSSTSTFYLEINAEQYDLLAEEGHARKRGISSEVFTPEQMTAIQKMIAAMASELEERWRERQGTKSEYSATFPTPAPFGR